MSNALECAKKFFDFLKGLMMLSLFSLLFLIFCYHFAELDALYESLLAEARSLNIDHVKVSAFGGEIDGFFSKQQVATQLETEGVDDPTAQDIAHALVVNFKPEEVDRLMYVGTMGDSCEFSNPSTKTQGYMDTDRQLKKKGLVEFEPDVATYERVRKAGETRENGLPMSCYKMKLTIEGLNAKTALVKSLGTIFKSNANNPRIAMK